MQELISNVAAQYGAMGILIFVLVWYSRRAVARAEKRDEEHATERAAWRKQAREQHQEVVRIAEKTNESLREQNVLVAEIKTLIKALPLDAKKNS
jgi:uncharacterized membrane protein YqiK